MASTNYKLSNLILPGSEDVYEIDAVYFGGKTAAEWQASTMSFKGTATISYTSGQPASTIVLEKVSGTYYKVASSLKPIVGDSYKIIFKSATETYTLYANSEDTAKGNFQIAHGDMIIYTAEGVWVDIPSGNDENLGTVTGITAGDGLTGGTITSSGSISADWGRIAKLAHSHNFSGTTGTPSASFSGSKKSLQFSYTPAGSVTISSEQVSSGGNYTPAGTISGVEVIKTVSAQAPTFTGSEATISASHTPVGSVIISATPAEGNGNYTPAGTISRPTFTGSEATISLSYQKVNSITKHTYTPAGGVSSNFTGETANISVSYIKATGITGTSYTPTGTVTSTFAGTKATISGNVSVSGSNSDQTVTVNEIELEHNVTVSPQTIDVPVQAEVTTNKPDITVSPSTESVIKTVTPVAGTAPSMTYSSFAHDYTSGSKTLKLVYTRETFSPGSTPIADVTTTTEDVVTSVSAALASAPKGSFTTTSSITVQPTVTVSDHKFTPEASVTKATWTLGTGTFSAEYTPAGSVNSTFAGDAQTITNTLNTESATTSTEYTPAGSVESTFNGTQAELTHTLNDAATQISTTYTPTGSVSVPTFTGSAVDITASFSGSPTTISTTYTPAGTITAPSISTTKETITPTFTGKLSKLSASFAGTAGSTNVIEYIPEGSVTVGSTSVSGSTTTSVNSDD